MTGSRMRDRSLFAVVLALVAGVFFWPGASRQSDREQSVASVVAGRAASAAGERSAKASAEKPAEAPHEAGRHGGAHPHVSGAMLLLLADYLKAVLMGDRLPDDLAAEAERQIRTAPGEIADRPDQRSRVRDSSVPP